MKTVFDNRQVCHVWAQQSQSHGRSNNGNLYFRNKVIFSYGEHFPLACFIDADAVLINSDSYSVSTSKQQGYVRSAVNYKKRFQVSKNALKDYMYDYSFNERFKKSLINETVEDISNTLRNAARRKKASLIEQDLNSAKSCLSNALSIFAYFKEPFPARFIELKAELEGDTDRLIAGRAADIKAEKQAEAEKAKIYAARQNEILKEALPAWYGNQPLKAEQSFAINRHDNIFMRIIDDEIETSKGARFPLDHGKKAFTLIRLTKESGKAIEKTVPIRLGHFTINSIDKHGNVKAGCHFVKWNEIERIARELNIYP